MSNSDITLSPVGVVRHAQGGFVLEIEPAFCPALAGLEGFSHLNVIWWSHFLDNKENRGILQCDRPYRNAPARLGIFATRSPMRPNPLCLSVAPVIHVDTEAGRILVAYIDAEDATPILDIKPYHPCADRVRDVNVPDWCRHWPTWFEDSADFDWEKEMIYPEQVS
jgi:tRNA-Thr(GGU) m(6)t(6)A37 methyltransferase TsaA